MKNNDTLRQIWSEDIMYVLHFNMWLAINKIYNLCEFDRLLNSSISSRTYHFYPKYSSPSFFKKVSGILQSPQSVRQSVTLSPPKPLDKIQPDLVCELLI